jgi:hypothetical protein
MKESTIQANVIAWWQLAHKGLGVPDARLFYHIPNGAYFGAGVKQLRGGKTVSLGAIRFSQLKRQGFIQGVPDLFLSVCRIHQGQFRGGLYIEMKKPKGRTSDEQREMHPLLRAQGYAVAVAFSFEEAVEEITAYLRGQPIAGKNIVHEPRSPNKDAAPSVLKTPENP